MKSSILISAIAAGSAITAGILAYLNKEKLPSLRSLKKKAATMLERRPKLPERYDYDHLRFGGLE
jgi:hypothetical protein